MEAITSRSVAFGGRVSGEDVVDETLLSRSRGNSGVSFAVLISDDVQAHNSWIDNSVEKINNRVNHNISRCYEYGDSLNYDYVALIDRVNEPEANAGNRKQSLDDDCSAPKGAEVNSMINTRLSEL